jgi:hypothetical protein
MKIKIIAILIISVVMLSFASTRTANKKADAKNGDLRAIEKPRKALGFVSEEI